MWERERERERDGSLVSEKFLCLVSSQLSSLVGLVVWCTCKDVTVVIKLCCGVCALWIYI